MRTDRLRHKVHGLALAMAALALMPAGKIAGEPDFSGVWGMVQHDRLGAPFFFVSRYRAMPGGANVA